MRLKPWLMKFNDRGIELLQSCTNTIYALEILGLINARKQYGPGKLQMEREETKLLTTVYHNVLETAY